MGDVLTDLFGFSGQLMLEAPMKGPSEAGGDCTVAKLRAKKRIPEIIAALQGHHYA
jgi:hypothetical protein